MPTNVLRTYAPPALLLVGAITLKLWGRSATPAQLDFLLYPASRALELSTGATAQHSAEGYLFPALGILIDSSCSGLTFFSITWATFGSLLLRRSMAGCWAPYLAIMAGAAAYGLTIMANASRIVSLAKLHQAGITLGQKQHEAVGSLCFVVLLLLASIVLDRHLATRTAHAPQP